MNMENGTVEVYLSCDKLLWFTCLWKVNTDSVRFLGTECLL